LALTSKVPGIQRPVSPVGLIQMCRLTIGICVSLGDFIIVRLSQCT